VEPVFNLESTCGPVRTEMNKQHSIISRLAGVLQGEINPAGVGAAAAAHSRSAGGAAPRGRWSSW